MKERIKHLLEQFEEGTLSREETDMLWELTGAEASAVEEGILEMMELQAPAEQQPSDDQDWAAVLNRIVSVDQPLPVKMAPSFTPLRWVAAAVILITFGLGVYFYSAVREGRPGSNPERYATDVPPGGNKAILKLADGSEISLTDAENGALVKQAGINIVKAADGQLVYHINPSKTSPEGYNTITTPRGGQYQVNLPDGTKVWLNAASSLKFPLSFTDQKTRMVELSGEAYFEVTKNKHQPFKVISTSASIGGRTQVLEVLGTHFNVNAYADEESIRTTLLEGSVRLNHQLTLKPGEQSIFAHDHFHVVPADTEETIAWKNGYFMFANEDLQHIMRKISRWYDLEIIYQGKITDNTFIGTVSRFKEVSEVLNILELTKTVHFKIEGRKIIVMP
ncbi:FecR family protein [Pedobacter steynii]|uniref:FecR protein n=1 Tax=Pedobacter steynii TaxID=430522 RepID=A0A1D7QBS0_9SPHI|nr:FecR family protein [Pedobacter steynii]AOM76150.1 hypothetical protein BFS30_02585 [Pedobacter steynii]